jgi:NAD(P)-dependent dehydrogenase (short-subunit alcohol dehydrogenase family)
VADDPFRDRVAVVTGGAGGIGMALARAFAGRGAKIVLADIHEERLATAVKELEAEGAAASGVPTDVTRRESVEALADAVYARHGAAHLVCNNAGIAVLGPMAKATEADWHITFDINFWGVVHGVQAFLPRMLEGGQPGHIVNTASMAGLVGMSWLGVYCASKFAVVGLTESLARELKGTPIGVSCLCPMIVETDINQNTLETLDRSERGPTNATAPPQSEIVGGVVQPAEVAQRVVRAVERNQLYVLTHPEQRSILRRRAGKQDEAFEPEAWELGD